MGDKQLRGVVIRVADIEAVRERYTRLLGVEPTVLPDHVFSTPGQIAGILFDLGESFIQFITEVGEEAPLNVLTRNRGEGLSQISLWVEDVDAEMRTFEAEGVSFGASDPQDLPLGLVAFGHPKTLNGVMWELEEHPFIEGTATPRGTVQH